MEEVDSPCRHPVVGHEHALPSVLGPRRGLWMWESESAKELIVSIQNASRTCKLPLAEIQREEICLLRVYVYM